MIEASSLVANAQIQSLNQPTTTHFQEEMDCQAKLNFLIPVEKEYFKQRSRINWLDTGDQNTSYFHMVIKARNAFNNIHTLTGLNGVIVSSPEEMGTLAADHFRSILGPLIQSSSQNNLPAISYLTRVSCSPEDVTMLSRLPTT